MVEQGNKRAAAGSQEEPFVDVLEKEEETIEVGEGKEERGRREVREGVCSVQKREEIVVGESRAESWLCHLWMLFRASCQFLLAQFSHL